MRACAGAREIECVGYSFRPDIRKVELEKLLQHVVSVVTVNGKQIASSPLCKLPLSSPLSGRFVHYINYPVAEGDEITASLESGEASGIVLEDGLTIDADISILGEFEVEECEKPN